MYLYEPKIRNSASARSYVLLRSALFELLLTAPFEKISLVAVCRRAMIPRATFYHYFEDKYHLLRYCIEEFLTENDLDFDTFFLEDQKQTEQFFYKLFGFIRENHDFYRRIYLVNRQGILLDEIQACVASLLLLRLQNYAESGCTLKVPAEMAADIGSFLYISIARHYLELEHCPSPEEFSRNLSYIITRDFFETSPGCLKSRQKK